MHESARDVGRRGTEARLTIDQRPQTVAYRRILALYGCVAVLALTLTWTFLGMRAVMYVGGSCAEGGPYVIAQPCPEGVWMISVAIPVMLISAMAGSAFAIGLPAPNLLLPMWAVLFGSLGWNFLEFGAFAGDLVWGYIVCGVVFELMALPAVWLLLPTRRERWVPPGVPPATVSGAWWWFAYLMLAGLGFVFGVWSYGAWS